MATVVSLHAHPDDEALLCGGWLAQRAAAGDRVVLLFATDGDAGLTAGTPSTPGTRGTGSLGLRRRREAELAARALGAARVAWLGYADSGMADSPTEGPRRLADAPVEEVARGVADLLDEEGAATLTGYDANGGYGHPDHRQVHRVARRAQDLAVRRPLLLEATLDRTWLVRLLRVVRPVARLLPGLTLPGDDIFTARTDPAAPGSARPVDVRDHLDAKRAALAAHASQATGGVRTVALLLRLPRPLARRLLGTEWFIEHR